MSEAADATQGPAREARRLVESQRAAALATAGPEGEPWASLVVYAALPDGSPVMLLSNKAEHGRNLARDRRASLLVAAVLSGSGSGSDPLDLPRVVLAGAVGHPDPESIGAAMETYLDQVPSARRYARFDDFKLWQMTVERIRYVGGFGSMAWVDVAAYRDADVDP